MNDYRNKPITRTCRNCLSEFTGKFNSSSCTSCKQKIKRKCTERFKQTHPNYFKENELRRKLDGRHWDGILRRQYGITLIEYNELKIKQENKCAICFKASSWRANAGKLVVDHCHRSGKVRGLLCPSCNRGLGQFEDDPVIMSSAVKYLQIERRQKAETIPSHGQQGTV